MTEYELEFASRQIRRAFSRAMGKSIPKILTELITNADDSYRRIEASSKQGKAATIQDSAPILIIFERSKRRFRVIDQAEGLKDEEMKDRFVSYGKESKDSASGFKTRSLFGKGLRDVLFTQNHGQVKSIKDGMFFNCRFRWKGEKGQEKPKIEIKPPSRVTNELRRAIQIPANGTSVEFQLADDVHNPQAEKLIETLSRFYMLRMINSSPHRELQLHILGSGGKLIEEKQLSYRFPEIEVNEKFQDQIETDIGTIIQINAEIGLTQEELVQGERGYSEREGGLLVLDESENVLDLTLFGSDEDPMARRISGTVRLLGAGAYIRAKLNQIPPEEILTETRDGFDKNHEFFRALRDLIQPHLQPLISTLKNKTPEHKSKLSERTSQRHRQALDLLNRIAGQMLGKTGKVPAIPGPLKAAPPGGIAFVNSHISIQTGVSTPTALLINTSMVQPTDVVTVVSDHPNIVVTPSTLLIEQEQTKESVQVKILRIRSELPDISGKLTATWRSKIVELDVTTTEREVITPVNGLEFERDEYNVKLESKRNLRLFLDLEKIHVGSDISILCEDSCLSISTKTITLDKSHMITPRVAQLDVEVIGQAYAEDIIVTAAKSEYVAGTKVSVIKKDKNEQGKQGLFKGYKFEPLERRLQTLTTQEGDILVNTLDPINMRYFGAEPYKAFEDNLHCQVRLADLILNECLWIMVSQALQVGKLDTRFPNNPEIDVRNYVDEKRFEIGTQFHDLFVTKAD